MNEPIRRQIRVRATLDHAFEVFTARIDLWWPVGHRRFDGSELVLEARVGGRFFERAPSGEEARLGDVIECEPPHRLRYTWFPGSPDAPTTVDVAFRRDGEHTVVEVVHAEGDARLGDRWPSRASLFVRGWETVLPAFAAAIEQAK